MDCRKEANLKNCNCTYSNCSRKGICCECIAFHRKSGELPACFFDAKTERSYDRSVEKFIEMKSG
ncbi:MAG: DUF6485 family protein [Candidatus Diapherotrites archaeon]